MKQRTSDSEILLTQLRQRKKSKQPKQMTRLHTDMESWMQSYQEMREVEKYLFQVYSELQSTAVNEGLDRKS